MGGEGGSAKQNLSILSLVKIDGGMLPPNFFLGKQGRSV